MGFPDSSVGKESACNTGDPCSIPGSGRSPGEGIGHPLQYSWASLVAQLVKNLSAMWRPGFELWLRKIPWRRKWQHTPLFLPGESPWTEKPGGLQPMGSQRARHEWVTKHSTAQDRGVLMQWNCTLVAEKHSYIFIKTYRGYNTKTKPSCKLWVIMM